MRRRSKMLRVAKWGGVVLCAVLLSAAAASRSTARLRAGDTIVSVDGKSISSFIDLLAASSKNKPVAVTVVDAGGNVRSVQLDFQSPPRGVFSFLASLPIWMALLVAAPTAFIWHLDRRRRPLPGHCPCGYDLRGNVSGVCPECGEESQNPLSDDGTV